MAPFWTSIWVQNGTPKVESVRSFFSCFWQLLFILLVIPSWIVQETLLDRSWGDLGPMLAPVGPSWGHIGPSWGHLGPILGPTWALLGHLGAILAHFEASGLSWGHLGPFRRHPGPPGISTNLQTFRARTIDKDKKLLAQKCREKETGGRRSSPAGESIRRPWLARVPGVFQIDVLGF